LIFASANNGCSLHKLRWQLFRNFKISKKITQLPKPSFTR